MTLLELLLAMAILAILATLAMPRYARSVARYRADLAARRLAADLKLAQRSAKSASASRTVTFTTAADEYEIPLVSALDGSGTYKVRLSNRPYEARLVSVVCGGDSQLIFNGWGMPDSAGSVTIAAGSEQKTVLVNAATGEVSIQ